MTTLSDELANDPESLGYQQHITEGNHQAVADILNLPRYSTVGAQVITSANLLVWAAQGGRLAALTTAIGNDALPADVRGVAEAAKTTILRDGTQLDLSRTEIQGAIDALVSAGVFSATDKTSLETLSTRDISRAEQLGLGRVSHRDIREAL